MRIYKRPDHSAKVFYLRTVSAQIHLLGCLLVVAGGAWLIPYAQTLGRWHMAAAAVFIVTGFLVFFTSSVYHFLHDGYRIGPRLEHLFENLDHLCIYLVIAGTYSPFILAGVSPRWRVPLLAVVWAIALAGIAYTYGKQKLPPAFQSRYVYVSLFVIMGWALLARIGDIFGRLSGAQVALLFAGGLTYTAGALVYAFKRPNPWRPVFAYHEIWHVLVVAGYACHFFLVVSLYRHPKCELSTDELWITACQQIDR